MAASTSSRIAQCCILFVLLGLTSCGGGNNQIVPAQQTPVDIPGLSGFEAAGSGTTSQAGLEVVAVRQKGQVLVQVVATEPQQLDSLFFDLSYNPGLFTPVSAQASEAIAPLSASLCIEILDVPGTVSCGQAPLTAAFTTVPAGVVLAEVLFLEQPFPRETVSAKTQVPQNNNALSPLVWDHDAGEFYWYMVNPGDYDQNGIVTISDLSPLAAHVGLAGPFSFFSAPSVIDGHNDGDINVADITPIVVNWNNYIEGFNLYSSDNLEDVPVAFNELSVIPPVASYSLAEAQGDTNQDRIWFSHTPEAGQEGVYFWVRPYAGETEGTRSNLMSPTMDSSPPIGNPGGGFNLPPQAALSLGAEGTSIPLPVSFDASGSVDPDGAIALYEWDFEGDGLFDSFSTEPLVQHTYSHVGTYAPLVRVSDDGGLWDAFQSPPFDVDDSGVGNIPPLADIFPTTTSGGLPFTVGLIATGSTDLDGYITRYEWDFDTDGTYDLDSGTDPTVLHTYTVSGLYFPTLRVTDNLGAIAIASVQVIALADNQEPVAELTAGATTGNAPFMVSFDASGSFDYDGTIVEYAWDWNGDGIYDGTSGSAWVSYSYLEEGTYTAILRVEDNAGSWGFDSLEITVGPPVNTPPVVDLQADVVQGLTPLLVNFDASASYDPDGTIVEYAWDWESDGVYDGITYVPTASHTFYSPGSPTVSVRAQDNEGGGATARLMIAVNVAGNDAPTADLVASPAKGDYPLAVTLDASGSNDPDGTITTYEWDFDGDGVYDLVDVNSSEVFIYVSEGLFEPSVRVTDNVGAQDSASDIVQVHVEDWPMFGHDLRHTRQSWFPGPQTNTRIWVADTAGGIWSSPVIGADGTIYIGSNDDKLYAFNPDGTEQWTYNTGDPVVAPPAVAEDGTIYFGSWSDRVYALNPDGTVLWSFLTGGNISGAPTIGTDGTIYIGSSDNMVYALNPDGTQQWAFTTDGGCRSSAAVSPGGMIYIGNDAGSVYAINPDGTQAWVFPTTGGVSSSPAIAEDGTIYFGSNDSNMYALNPDGTQYWAYPTTGAITSSPAIAFDGTIYVGSYDHDLHAVNPDGTMKWRYTTGNIVRGSAAIGFDGTVYVGSYDNSMHAINPDGTLFWTYATNGDILSSPAISLNGTLLFGSTDKKVYAIRGV